MRRGRGGALRQPAPAGEGDEEGEWDEEEWGEGEDELEELEEGEEELDEGGEDDEGEGDAPPAPPRARQIPGSATTVEFTPDDFVEVGLISRAHGIKGEVKVQLITDEPKKRLGAPGRRLWLQAPAGRGGGSAAPGAAGGREQALRRVVVQWGRVARPPSKDRRGEWAVKFQEVPDRDKAETLAGHKLLLALCDREASPRSGDEFFVTDLVGLRGLDAGSGVLLGLVTEVYDSAASYSLLRLRLAPDEADVAASRYRTVLVPFVEAMVPRVDVRRGTLALDLPDGLLQTASARKLRRPYTPEQAAALRAQAAARREQAAAAAAGAGHIVAAAAPAAAPAGGTEISSSVLIYALADMARAPDGGPAPCEVAIARSAGFNARKVSFVLTVFTVWNGNVPNATRYYYKDSRGQFVPAAAAVIADWQAGLTRCFRAAVDAGARRGRAASAARAGGRRARAHAAVRTSAPRPRPAGFTTLHVVGHANVIRGRLHDRSLWRNVVRLHPAMRFGPEPAASFSYADTMLLPAAAALAAATSNDTAVEFAVAGEMGLSTWSFPREWLALLQTARSVSARGKDPARHAYGVSFNYNKVCACVEPEERDPAVYNATYLERFDRFRAAGGLASVDVPGMRALLDASDFIGVSCYAPLPLELGPAAMEAPLRNLAFELSPFGIDLRRLVGPQRKRLICTEQGLGGYAADSAERVPGSLDYVRAHPYAGSPPGYDAARDPWKVPAYAAYRRRLYEVLAGWAAAGGGPQYRIDGVFVWSSGSWDLHGVHPSSPEAGESYADPAIQASVRAANALVNGLNVSDHLGQAADSAAGQADFLAVVGDLVALAGAAQRLAGQCGAGAVAAQLPALAAAAGALAGRSNASATVEQLAGLAREAAGRLARQEVLAARAAALAARAEFQQAAALQRKAQLAAEQQRAAQLATQRAAQRAVRLAAQQHKLASPAPGGVPAQPSPSPMPPSGGNATAQAPRSPSPLSAAANGSTALPAPAGLAARSPPPAPASSPGAAPASAQASPAPASPGSLDGAAVEAPASPTPAASQPAAVAAARPASPAPAPAPPSPSPSPSLSPSPSPSPPPPPPPPPPPLPVPAPAPTPAEVAAYPTGTWEGAPACVAKPTGVAATRDGAGRLWGFESGRSCAYRGWDEAPPCAALPQGDAARPDAAGHVWGFEGGVSCAWRGGDGRVPGAAPSPPP
ncbi:rimM [Scenedesmus sp. PABB004]|nr:rimM [Scenedesmus sp. PABB004]